MRFSLFFLRESTKHLRQTLWDIVVDVSKAQLIEPASTGGLRACFFIENLTKHASASYDFGRTYASRKYARWMLGMLQPLLK